MSCDRGNSAALVRGVISHATGLDLPKTIVCDTAVSEEDRGKYADPESASYTARTMFEQIGVDPDSDPAAKALIERIESGRVPVTLKLERAMRSRFPAAVHEAESKSGTTGQPRKAKGTTVLSGTIGVQAIESISKTWGYRPQDVQTAITQIRGEAETGGLALDQLSGNKYLTPQDTVDLITATANPDDPEGTKKLIEKALNGQLLLSHRDAAAALIAIDRVKNLQEENTTLDKLQPLGGQWVDSVCQRRCTICGQFIGKRGEHGGEQCRAANSEAFEKRFEELEAALGSAIRKKKIGDRRGYSKRRDILGAEDVADGENLDYDYPVLDYSDLPTLTDDEFSDAYTSYPQLRSLLLLSRLERKGIFNTGPESLPLTGQARDTWLENPHVSESLGYYSTGYTTASFGLVAARIEPPLNDVEIGRLATVAGSRGIDALLKLKRTREQTLRYITEYPSEGAAILANQGGLDEQTLNAMASSGDPKVRMQAALAPNTPQATRLQLAQDPDPTVRRALATTIALPKLDEIPESERNAVRQGRQNSGLRGYAQSDDHYNYSPPAVNNNPELAAAIINDPDPDIAIAGFRNLVPEIVEEHYGNWDQISRYRRNPLGPAHVALAAAVTSPERLNDLKLEVIDTKMWPEDYRGTTEEFRRMILDMEL